MLRDYVKRPVVKIIFIVLAATAVFIILLDRVILPWYVSSPETQVPSVLGLKTEEAMQRLSDSNLDPVVSDTTFDEKYPMGTVLLQNPGGGEVVKHGRRVYLYVSGGDPIITVPSLRGRSIRDAKFTLERIGLRLGNTEEMPSNNPRGMIFDQQFAEGTRLKKGETVNVYVSSGVETETGVVVPDLVGKSLSEAERTLTDNNLRVGKVNYQRSFSLLPNTVLDQYPSSGNRIKEGETVDLFVTTSADPLDENEIIEE
jgi:eukaryotic-like serine/threonine-protein kinase